MRYIIYGAGAVGGAVGARLFQAGLDVLLLCRGTHLEAIRRNGLHLRAPDEEVTLPITAVGHPREIDWRPDDVVILTMKTHDTDHALADLESASGYDVPVICCQNGVENERLAARRFTHVYGMLVALPATFLRAGHIDAESLPVSGVLDSGRYPSGIDPLIEHVAADMNRGKLSVRPTERVMRWKYAKLASNLGNALQIVTGFYRGGETFRRLDRRLRDEALACYAAAGIDAASDEEYAAEVLPRYQEMPIAGSPRAGSSTWQSLLRGHTRLETDYLNGEITLLGRLHGVPTPVNEVVRRLSNRIALGAIKAGSLTYEQVDALVTRYEAATR